ncbi:MAG: bifunctional diaminohydroxyphosphoribosylaminopyrimidine deaminase/5-amino-6-(5-phosphoribosylamino)uracil reductase RibD [bacterium]|nr:bifunctional diaminohydroxyphosphoribosylaminopyrimidine deaminase/5-amino-6-(5-phosphoribosylamino)uracil reductase RibD [bacterium]
MSSQFTIQEQEHMRRALVLARRGQGRVEPNPMVGCVLVRRGVTVGEGYHQRFGGPHAEVEALRRAGSQARGASAFVTLEPCCHQGKTPPCTTALIDAGVRRVVVATPDPFPAVSGKGIRRLRRAGMRVNVGLLEEEARELNAPFFTLVIGGRPYTLLKWAQSLDGKIATRTGDSRWISSPESRRRVHLIRARVDAVLVGIGTVLADDPLLTARDVPVRRVATRVVLDSRLRTPIRAALVKTARTTPTLILTTRGAATGRSAKVERMRRAGVEIVVCRARQGRIDLRAALGVLGARQFTTLMIEGGGTVLGAMLDSGLVDEAQIFVSPRLIGGDAAPGPYRGLGVPTVATAKACTSPSIQRVGGDLLYRLRFPAGLGRNPS